MKFMTTVDRGLLERSTCLAESNEFAIFPEFGARIVGHGQSSLNFRSARSYRRRHTTRLIRTTKNAMTMILK